MLRISRWGSDLLGLLFPNLCNACGASLFQGEKLICTKCLFDLPFTDYHLYQENKVMKQLWGRVPLNAAMALLYFRKGATAQRLIHSLKYNGKTDVGLLLGSMIGERLKLSSQYSDIDFIVPVPLHHYKLRSRGYNQSSFIAEGIAQTINIPFKEEILIRTVSTESQTKKNRFSRYENMKAVFKVPETNQIAGKHILLVDDVVTTGATLESCTNALLAYGALKVSIAAVAFAE
ncbi:ComF family protein [Pedobacter psychrotolerans]|uniref:Amidophosphoribosyltransferase n=1 Tax=Pedobacter psychrotolerans TaxID=1843235 RepID=A0A4R2HEA7_9SPHI|nr:ComF family protein [Pedobacter psychrotolerans]TCO26671.1 ComF family protein [Pedobacter psychrotolerans]GGE55606.1 amidophosphoribosyltransferase [Pedobacter psychrotolerans]